MDARRHGRRLLRAGALLFLLGLLVGFAIPSLANPRMGLSSHLEGVMNGMLLLVLGVIWERLRLGPRNHQLGVGLALFGTYANWGTTLLAAVIGAGEPMMPFAAAGFTGSAVEEGLIAAGLIALSLAMVGVSGLVLWGLRGPPEDEAPASVARA